MTLRRVCAICYAISFLFFSSQEALTIALMRNGIIFVLLRYLNMLAEKAMIRIIEGTTWVPACCALTKDDRPGEWTPLLEHHPAWAIILPNGEPVLMPTLGQMSLATRFSDCPWGDVLIPLQWANAIRQWRITHPDSYDVPYPM